MKNLKILSVLATMGLLLLACNQQLVEFPMDLHVTNNGKDMGNNARDMDNNDLLNTDLLSSYDLQVITSDMQNKPGPLSACAAMFGVSGQSFAVLGGSAITSTGPTLISGGDVGISPGSSIVGFPPALIDPPNIISSLVRAAAAQIDLTKIYTCTQSAVCNQVLTGVDLTGLTLKPGVYCFSSSAGLTGNLVFDADGDPNAIWFIQIGSTLTVSDGSQMTIIGGKANNIYWQVGSSATIGKAAHVVGNILSLASITINTASSVCGRALARNGAVTLDTDVITVSNCN